MILKSIRISSKNEYLPNNYQVIDMLEKAGYNKYIPITFLSDMFIIGKQLLFGKTAFNDDYQTAIADLLNTFNIKYLIKDIINILNEFSKKFDLREFEAVALGTKSMATVLQDNKKSQNYRFDIKLLQKEVIDLLDITNKELEEVDAVDASIVEILDIANYIGDSFKVKTVSNESKALKMTNYSQVTKINKIEFAKPLFTYKFSIKEFDVNSFNSYEAPAKTLIIGFFVNSFGKGDIFRVIIKLLGVIALQYNNPNIIVYDFYDMSYTKYHLQSIKDIVEFFKAPKQLKLFPVNNNFMLNSIVKDNKNCDIVLIPNVNGSMSTHNNNIVGTNINIISTKASLYNRDFKNICTKTSGKFIEI